MKSRTIMSLVASVAVTLCGIPAEVHAGPTGSPKGSDCKSVAAGLRKAVAANPSRVLVYVEDAMISNPDCACDIVKAAILGADAATGTPEANALVKQIVETAVTAAPSMSAVIAECAMAVAPGASAEIQAALDSAIGEGAGADFGPAPDVRGIYLVPPVASGATLVQQIFEDADDSARKAGKTVVEKETVIERERVIIRRPRPRPPVSPSFGD